jgi:hypothetical protein
MSVHKTRIMYIEDKSGGLEGPARIGRVTFSKSGRSLTYGGRTFQSLGGSGFKANYVDVDTRDEFWISGPRKDGADRLYAGGARSMPTWPRNTGKSFGTGPHPEGRTRSRGERVRSARARPAPATPPSDLPAGGHLLPTSGRRDRCPPQFRDGIGWT